jgi:tetratricopeptide (TPR) repeat protein
MQGDAALAELGVLRIAAIVAGGGAEAAVAAAQAWRAERPDLAAAHLAEGMALLGIARLEAALAACRRAGALALPGAEALRAEALLCEAEAYLPLGRRDQAMAALAAVLAARPEPETAAIALVLRADLLAADGEPAEALEAYEAALVLRPNRAWALRGQALAREALGRPDAALAAWARLAELGPPHAAAEARMALARLGGQAPPPGR